MPHYKVASLVVLLAVPSALAGQTVQGYARNIGDTARYQRQSTVSVITDWPQGPVEESVATDESIGMTFLGGDSALVWLDRLEAGRFTPRGHVQPSASAVLGRPFVVRMDARGRVDVLAEPALPDSITRIVDFKLDLARIFPHFPDAPLAVGAEWSDTINLQSTIHGDRLAYRTILHYRAERDTTIDSASALVVSGTETNSTTFTTLARNGNPGSASVLRGSGTAVYVFAPSTGRWMAGTHTGDASGELNVYTGAGVKTYPQTAHYQDTSHRLGSP